MFPGSTRLAGALYKQPMYGKWNRRWKSFFYFYLPLGSMVAGYAVPPRVQTYAEVYRDRRKVLGSLINYKTIDMRVLGAWRWRRFKDLPGVDRDSSR